MNKYSFTPALPQPMSASPRVNVPVLVRPVSPALSLAIWLLYAELLIVFSRFFDVIATGYKIPGIVYFALMGLIVVSGALLRAFSSRITAIICAFVIWLAITIPFSMWRTGSLDAGRATFQCLVIFIAVSGIPVTARDCIRALYVLGFATLIGAALSFVFGSMETGRLEMQRGSFADPNEYAMTLLMGLPFLILMVRAKNLLARGAGIVFTAVSAYAFLRTGSRGGMIAVLITGMVLFWGVSWTKKAVVVSAAAAALLVASLTLPGYLRERYFTFFSVDDANPVNAEERALLEGADISSTEGRMRLLKASLWVTVEHPLFGVGPSNFPLAYWQESKAEGKRVAWNVSHNTYTQISSETGVLGGLLFIAFLVKAFQATRRVMRDGAAAGHPELARAAYHLWLSLTAVCASAFFLSIGYSPMFYVLGGLAVAFERAAFGSGTPQHGMVSVPIAAHALVPASVKTPAAAPVPVPVTAAPRTLSGKEVRALLRKL